MTTYSSPELMTVNAARLLRDGDVVFVGVGLPNLACNLARRTHAPNLTMIYEAGVVGAQPQRLPLSIGDPSLVSGAATVCSMYEIFAFYLQRGLIDVGFLGGASARKKRGVRGGGPKAVVTDVGILEPDPNGELILTALHPGKTDGDA